MRKTLLVILIVLSCSAASHAQYPLNPDSIYTEGVTYIDLGVGTYGFEIAATGQPVENWGGALFLRAYPGPFGPLYSIDSRYMAGAVLKYYGILSEGFYSGPMIGAEITPAIRPVLGATFGYDFFSKFRKRSDFKNFHFGFELQGGIDTEGEGFIGAGVKVGFAFKNDEPLVNWQ